eukprot:c19131_g1_i1 orf=569-2665(+)
MMKLLKKKDLRLMNLVLWMLTTRIGTFIFGGRHAMVFDVSLIHRFADLPLVKRQKILWSLSQNPFRLNQELFRFLKCFICWIFFTKVDENGQSPIFNVMQYRVPSTTELMRSNTIVNSYRDLNFKPLEGKVVDAGSLDRDVSSHLRKLGVPLLEDISHLKALMRTRLSKQSCHHPEIEVGVKCDCVILGSGSGGSVVAGILAQAGYKVIILEKGFYFARGDLSLLEQPSMYTMYEERGCLVSKDSSTILLSGSTVGGGSTVNWSASFRTPPHVRKEWATTHKLELFASSQYDKAMDAVCSRIGVQAEVENENFQNSVLREGCLKCGYHVENIPRNNKSDHYCGFCGLGCKSGEKKGTAETWLVDATAHGAIIFSGCTAEEILHVYNTRGSMKKRTVRGVAASFQDNRGYLFVDAKVVVAACGALRTPPLLKKSGLRNPNIGRNLHIHPVQVVWGYFPADKGPKGMCYEGGIMTAYSKVAANWDGDGYGALLECPAVQPGLISLAMPWRSGADLKTRMAKFPRTAFLLALARDKGSGSVTIDGDGRLEVDYILSNFDKESLKTGAEHCLRILAAAGAVEIGTMHTDGEIYRADGCSAEELEAYLQRARSHAYKKLSTIVVSAHQMGSCRMGMEAGTSGVDERGETWEVAGLFVGDSSVFPTATGVNPMITVQAIAYSTAQSILTFLNNNNNHHHLHQTE